MKYILRPNNCHELWPKKPLKSKKESKEVFLKRIEEYNSICKDLVSNQRKINFKGCCSSDNLDLIKLVHELRVKYSEFNEFRHTFVWIENLPKVESKICINPLIIYDEWSKPKGCEHSYRYCYISFKIIGEE